MSQSVDRMTRMQRQENTHTQHQGFGRERLSTTTARTLFRIMTMFSQCCQGTCFLMFPQLTATWAARFNGTKVWFPAILCVVRNQERGKVVTTCSALGRKDETKRR